MMTGALVLRARRNGGEVVDLVGVPIMRETGEITLIRYYAYGSIVAESGLPNIGYDTSVSIVDRSNSWQIVGARVDRQYWHGGVLSNVMTIVHSGEGEVQIGDTVMLCAQTVTGVNFAISMVGCSPIGGEYGEDGFVCVYDGVGTVSEDIRYNIVNIGITLPSVKAIPIKRNDTIYAMLLYPYDTADIVRWPYFEARFTGPQDTDLDEDSPGPYYLSEV